MIVQRVKVCPSVSLLYFDSGNLIPLFQVLRNGPLGVPKIPNGSPNYNMVLEGLGFKGPWPKSLK